VFRRTFHRSLPSARLIQSIPNHLISLRSIVLSAHLRLGLPSDHFPSGFPTTLSIVLCSKTNTVRKLDLFPSTDEMARHLPHWVHKFFDHSSGDRNSLYLTDPTGLVPRHYFTRGWKHIQFPKSVFLEHQTIGQVHALNTPDKQF
jgi:hypothetical protein